MYLGQERWARAAQTWTPAQQSPRQGSGQFSQQPPPPTVKEIGDASHITVSGCNHGVVGPIVCGSYTLTSLNHGKPAYRKEQQPGKPDVMLYFWDERDGVGSSGWWLSPKIGSEVVWGFHPNRTAQTPPTTGWKVPYDGGVDPNFLITARRAGGAMATQAHMQAGRQAGPQPVGMRVNSAQAMEAKQREMMRQEEVNRKRVEDQRKRMEEVRRQQEEAAKKQKEEQAKRLEEMRKQQEQMREERRAVSAIRQVFQKLRTAKQEDFETLEAELHITLDKELDNCGSQKAALKEESSKCLEQAKQRCVVLAEQKRKMEEKRAEEEKKRKEAQELAEKLLAELDDLVGNAETAAEALKKAVDKFLAHDKIKSVEDITKAAKPVQDEEVEAQKTLQAATDHVTAHRAELAISMKSQAGVLAPKIGEKAKEESNEEKAEKPNLAVLQQKLAAHKSEVNKSMSAFRVDKDKKEKRVVAQAAVDQGLAAFRKYDKDKDGALSKKEIGQYAVGECGFTLPSESVDLIFEVLVKPGTKGVDKKDVQRLKVMVGVARERERDLKRHEDRLQHEKELAESKAELVEKIKGLTGMIDNADDALKKAEELVKTAPVFGADKSAQEAVDYTGKVEEAVKQAKDLVTATLEKVGELNGLESQDHRNFIRSEFKRLQRRTGSFEGRITRPTAWIKKVRGDAKRRAAEELEQVHQRAQKALWEHQRHEKLKSEALPAAFGLAEGGGGVAEAAFLAVFARCQERRKSEEAGSEGPEVPAAEELKRLFAHLCEEGQDEIALDALQRFARRYMKVVKDTVITHGLSVKEKMVRRLEAKEVVEVLEGPVKEDSVGVERVYAKAMSDGAVGWITICGNQNTLYLEEGGGIFKVVKETILTDSFELAAAKDVTRKLHDTTRKLLPAELVEVFEWPKLEEASGLTRMKCRAKSDGQIGWVTTVGNQGATFLEVA